jgi:hypothetical protein
LFSVCLALVALNSLTDAGPLPENRNQTKGAPPKEVQKINIWLGEKKTSDILKDILEVAKAIKNIKKNKKLISGENFNSSSKLVSKESSKILSKNCQKNISKGPRGN